MKEHKSLTRMAVEEQIKGLQNPLYNINALHAQQSVRNQVRRDKLHQSVSINKSLAEHCLEAKLKERANLAEEGREVKEQAKRGDVEERQKRINAIRLRRKVNDECFSQMRN